MDIFFKVLSPEEDLYSLIKMIYYRLNVSHRRGLYLVKDKIHTL